MNRSSRDGDGGRRTGGVVMAAVARRELDRSRSCPLAGGRRVRGAPCADWLGSARAGRTLGPFFWFAGGPSPRRDERRWMICRHGESALQSPNALSSPSDIRPPASPLPRLVNLFVRPLRSFAPGSLLVELNLDFPSFFSFFEVRARLLPTCPFPSAKRHPFSHRSPPLTGQQPQNLREAYSKRLDRRIPVQPSRQHLHLDGPFSSR